MVPEKSNSTYPVSNQIKKSDYEEISVRDIIQKFIAWKNYILRQWKIVLLAVILGATAGFFYASNKKILYVATCTFVLEDDNGGGSGGGQFAGLTSLVGINLGGGGGGGGMFQGDNLFELYRSRKMLQKTLLSPISSSKKKDLLIDRFIVLNKADYEDDDYSKLKLVKFDPSHVTSLTRLQDSVLLNVIDKVNTKHLEIFRGRTGIITVNVRSENEVFAKQFNDQIVSTVNDFYVQTKTKKALENLAILQHQTDSIRAAMHRALTGIATSIDANPNANLSRQILRVPSQGRQTDAETNKAILSELVRNLEMAKVALRKETPLIQIIDEPIYPLRIEGLSRAITATKWGVLAGVLTILILSVLLLYRKIVQEVA
ncbi:lipopolysaccharide biosynthesis protein [Mucilaginibacter robiniae]|uniref:Lipopolysaccharide biosynthesis protein n=1 Tax=Mucilaginibacter robiniae TaxID=2728022 RepID=A0A7L5E331_9SPHI|nr:lipopolysaccharide biosynthesis protein [Mucilaginibacter robiniae]QJD97535.1 lipopolysaccharide biosynthesis protein [Mucilaginibacter robiniae]